MKKPSLCIIVLFLFAISCDKEAGVQPKEYPYIITTGAAAVSEGANLSAELLCPGEDTIVSYGFVWGRNTNPTISNGKILFNDSIANNNYSYYIKSGLENNVIYYVRAYIKTEQYEVYGNELSFLSMGSETPVVSDIVPDEGRYNVPVEIHGKNFGYDPSEIVVKFDTLTASIDSMSDEVIYVRAPLKSGPGGVFIAIKVAGMTFVPYPFFKYL